MKVVLYAYPRYLHLSDLLRCGIFTVRRVNEWVAEETT